MEKKIKLKGTAFDSVLLTFVRLVTAFLGILITKLLSTQFSLQEYGTYSQANLLVSTTISFTILGLSDATNYFYNSVSNEKIKRKNISTIFGLQYIIGVFAVIVIIAFQNPIIGYFKNPDLKQIIIFVALMPLFENLISMLQVLFVSTGNAKLIALRNFGVSSAKLLIVFLACFITKSIYTIFAILLFLDVLQVVIFMKQFADLKFKIRLTYFKARLIPNILRFCIPMAIYVLVNSLNRDIDKYVIMYFTDTETLGIYSNAAKILPFDMITASFITVLTPIITREVRSGDNSGALLTLKMYMRVCYLTTWVFVVGAIINARELMLLFYDEKFLVGLPVFIVYLFVDLIRLMGTTLVITASGKTKILMCYSIATLALNFIFNIVTFKMFGMIGPAVTTFVVTLLLTGLLLRVSAKELNSQLRQIFDWKEILMFCTELVLIGIVARIIKQFLYLYIASPIIILILDYGIFCLILMLLNMKKIISLMKAINRLR